ncbi:C40 family peptidase [Citreicella sp. C3M06]|uniref:C40 family peptidase n=1 Tax=Citreicella sp. C3M06 TaxID=2841564 RepID=UPI001C0A618A|nr:C40 family peptidase [Citreicella sp. C3M06]
MIDARQRPANDRVVSRGFSAQYPDLTPVDPRACFVSVPVVDLAETPGGKRARQLRYGDAVDVLEDRGGALFVYAPGADYAGWLADGTVQPATARPAPTLRIGVRQTHVYPLPDMKTRERCALTHLSTLSATGRREGGFTETELGWIPTPHLAEGVAADPVAIAGLYLGTPYLWGGNSGFGIDCSGLVQAALMACGRACPGDSDLQQNTLGQTLPQGTTPQRGDLLFWKGHVALVSGPDQILHANAFHMAVAFEGLTQAVNRINAQGDGPVTRHARL